MSLETVTSAYSNAKTKTEPAKDLPGVVGITDMLL